MRNTAVLVAAVLLTVPAAAAHRPTGDIRITSKALYTQRTEVGRITVYLLYNRRLSPNPIGNAQLLCADMPGGGPLPYDAAYCWGNYAIGRSTLNIEGVARRRLYFQVAVVGGTGAYAGANGTATIIRYSSRPVRERLVFHLTN